MNTSITQSWSRIETWLEAHAPETFAALEPPAADADIEAAEAAMGMAFPPALVESMRCHAGSGGMELLPGGWSLTPPAVIADEWRVMTEVWHEAFDEDEHAAALDVDAGDAGPWWHPRWVPFARDVRGEGMVIDQRANGRTGRIGVRYKHDGAGFAEAAMWTSLTEFFAHFAHCLETGEDFDDWTVIVESGQLDWDI